MKRSVDALYSPVVVKKPKEDDNPLPVPPNAGDENEVTERRLVNAYPTYKKTTVFVDFKQEMIFKIKVDAQVVHIQLIKTDQGVARWRVSRGEAWAIHHRCGIMKSIGKVVEFNSLLIGSHVSCNICVPGGPAFAWRISCCISGSYIEKTQIH